MPYLRFELVEQAATASNRPLQQIVGGERLWLDDFGSGLANFSAVGAWRYQYIKVARELFTLLKQSEEGVQLLGTLIKMMNQHSDGVIVEGVETEQEWRLVQRSGALAAQGYYLSARRALKLYTAYRRCLPRPARRRELRPILS